jgi:formimidoylglutamate deiminase
VDGAWAFDVRLDVAADGTWRAITPQGSAQGATVLDGPVLPGIVNAHSHAFQRAIAGLTEQGSGTDDFWSWRDRMYRVALRITPAQLEAIATQLYAELLAGGYTQVCEFHYLHNDVDGRAYADPLEMSLALVRAAQATGMGLTLLPTLYMRSGFGAGGPARRPAPLCRHARQRVAHGRIHQCIAPAAYQRGHGAAFAARRGPGRAGRGGCQAAKAAGWPVHIHIAEQVQEVNDCLAHTWPAPD